VCLSCAPPNAILRPQVYRHCDSISIRVDTILPFYQNWIRKGEKQQRAAMLFGTYIDEPEETKNPGAIRAEVQALYEPPQAALQTGGVRFINDPNEKNAYAIAKLFDLEVVGWVVTTTVREGAKYGGKVFMSGSEVRQAARYQARFKNAAGHSSFVTVILEHGQTVDPVAYQLSDQCVALERDGVLDDAPDKNMLTQRKAKEKEMLPSIVYKDKPLLPGTEFLPDELIVKVACMSPLKPNAVFKHSQFPSDGNDSSFRNHMRSFSSEPYEVKLSDFNALVYLASTIGLTLTEKLCKAIKSGSGLTKQDREELDKEIVKKNLL